MTDRAIETSPQTYAKIGGYLIIIAIGLFGEAFVRGKVIVSADAAATAANLRTMESLVHFHIAAELVLLICAVIVLWILFSCRDRSAEIWRYLRYSSTSYRSALKP
jgi:ABC-type Fe3+-siderophore transport system permease subunit